MSIKVTRMAVISDYGHILRAMRINIIKAPISLHAWTWKARFELYSYFGRYTQQWAQPVTAGVHGVSSKKCRLEVVE